MKHLTQTEQLNYTVTSICEDIQIAMKEHREYTSDVYEYLQSMQSLDQFDDFDFAYLFENITEINRRVIAYLIARLASK